MTKVSPASRRRSTATSPARTTAPARASAWAVSGCTTGCSAAPGTYDEEPTGEATGEDAERLIDKDVHVMGGAEVIRQALVAGIVDELTIIVAPVILGGGKRLFDGFSRSVDLEHLGVRQSPFATFIDYRVRRGS